MSPADHLKWRRTFLSVLRFVTFLFAAVGILVTLVTVTRVVDWWANRLAGRWEDPSGEVLVVLSGSVLGDGTIDQTSYWRSVYALRAWKEGGFQWIVIVGGAGRQPPVSQVMADFLQSQGVPRDAILIEGKSRSTRENALFSRDLLNSLPGRKVLLTSDYHMYRALHTFHKAGIDVIPRPFPDVRKRATWWLGRWPGFIELIAETAKILYYHKQGWI